MLSLAVFFGLRSQGLPVSTTPASSPSAPPPPPDLELPDEEEQPWIETAAESGDASSEGGAAVEDDGGPPPRQPAEVHDVGAFNTRWLPQRGAAEKACDPRQYFEIGASIWYVELPLEMAIAADGSIRKVRRFAKLRAVADSGSFQAVDIDREAEERLVRCYADQVAGRVRFDRATADGQLKAWVRVVSTVDSSP